MCLSGIKVNFLEYHENENPPLAGGVCFLLDKIFILIYSLREKKKEAKKKRENYLIIL